MKKKMIKFLVILLIIIAVIVMIFVFNTMRKVKIIENLREKKVPYEGKTNYHFIAKSYSTGLDNTIEMWKKEDEILWITNVDYHTDRTSKVIRYTDGTITNSYYEEQVDDQITKEAELGEKDEYIFIDNITMDVLHTENFWDLFWVSAFCSIKTETMNGKECYKITNFRPEDSFMIAEGDTSLYIEKDSGLIVRQMTGFVEEATGEKLQTYQDLEYEFDCVTEEDLIEPNISEYTILDEE